MIKSFSRKKNNIEALPAVWELYQDLTLINGNRNMFYFINSVEPEQQVSIETR